VRETSTALAKLLEIGPWRRFAREVSQGSSGSPAQVQDFKIGRGEMLPLRRVVCSICDDDEHAELVDGEICKP
jgi:hypothetical protein